MVAMSEEQKAQNKNYVFRKVTNISGSYAVTLPQDYYIALGSPAYAKVSLVKHDGEVYIRIDPA